MTITYKSGLCTTDKLKPLTNEQLLDFYNEMVDDGHRSDLSPTTYKHATEIDDRPLFHKRCIQLYSAIVARRSPKKATVRSPHPSTIPDNTVITRLTEVNPKKLGSKSYERFTYYRQTMSVGEYVAAVGKRSQAMADLKWDESKGYIALIHVAADAPSDVQQEEAA